MAKTQTPAKQKTMLTMPPQVVRAFSTLADSGEVSLRDQYITALRLAGWTLQSIAEAADITRERVRQVVVAIETPDLTAIEHAGLVVPEPPLKKVKAKPEYVEPKPETLERLLELQPKAQRVRSRSPEFRKEAEEYTKLLWQAHTEEGVPLYRLAKRLGVTHGALRFRLARYGYKTPPKGTSRVFAPINEQNRAVE